MNSLVNQLNSRTRFRKALVTRLILLGMVLGPMAILTDSLAAQAERQFIGYPYFAFKVENGNTDLRLYVRQVDSIMLTRQDDIEKGYFLLNDPAIRAALNFSPQQNEEFVALFRQLDAKTIQFGTVSYQELNEWSFRYRFFAAKEKMVQYYETRVGKILKDGQKDLLLQHAKRHQAKSQGLVEWLTSESVQEQLNLSKAQVNAVKKRHEKEWPDVEKSEAEWHKKFLNTLLEKLGPKKKGILAQRFGKNFEETLFADREKWLKGELAKPIAIWTLEFSGKPDSRKAKWVPQKPGPRNRYQGVINLKRVRKNLELTDEQREELGSLREVVEAELKNELPRHVFNLENREAEYHFQDEVERRSAQYTSRILLPHQRKRLKELSFVIQSDSPMALAMHLIQQTKMIGESERDRARIRVEAEMLAGEWKEELIPIHKSYRRKLISELDEAQQEKLHRLFGVSFFEDGDKSKAK